MRDVVVAYCRYNGLRVIEGDYGCADVLYPFLLMDLVYGIWQKELAGVPAKHKMKQARNRWREAYGLFTRGFFAAFSAEERDRIVDLMDEYEKWMEGCVMVARVAVMDAIKDRGFEDQKFLSACTLCNCLAQCAQMVWGMIFLDGRGKPTRNKYIDVIEKAALDFADGWFDERGDRSIVDLNGNERVEDAMNGIKRRISQFPPFRVAKDAES